MPAATEILRLRRDTETLRDLVQAELHPTRGAAMTSTTRRALRSEIELCIRALDELRSQLAG